MAMLAATRVGGQSVPVQVDAWSDISCPWCYVAKVRFDRAVRNVEAEFGTKLVSIKWHPYIIDLKTNPAGEEYLAYNQRRWGSDGWTISLKRQVIPELVRIEQQSGAKDGAVFKDWKWWPNSLNAHRLLLLADNVGKADEAKQMLFTLTYEEGKNVSDLEVLCSAGESLGMHNVREYLESDAGTKEVMEQDKAAKLKLGIQAVPYFIINGSSSISGARDTRFFEDTIRAALSSE